MANAADACDRKRPGRSVATGHEPVITQPALIMPESSASQPSVVLSSEYHAAYAVVTQHAPSLGECFCHLHLEERSILRQPFELLCLVLYDLANLRRERVARVPSVAQWMPRQGALEPDEEEIREVRVGHCIVVGRVGEPERCGVRRQGMVRGVSRLDLARIPNHSKGFGNPNDCSKCCSVVASLSPKGQDSANPPQHRDSLATERMHNLAGI